MKRIELLKKTGICFTALASAVLITAAAPGGNVYAADFYGGMDMSGTDSLSGSSPFDSYQGWGGDQDSLYDFDSGAEEDYSASAMWQPSPAPVVSQPAEPASSTSMLPQDPTLYTTAETALPVPAEDPAEDNASDETGQETDRKEDQDSDSEASDTNENLSEEEESGSADEYDNESDDQSGDSGQEESDSDGDNSDNNKEDGETDTDGQEDDDSQEDTDTSAETDTEDDSGSGAGTKDHSDSESESGTDAKDHSDSESESGADAKDDPVSESESGADAENDPVSESESGADAENDPVSESESGNDRKTDAVSGSDSESSDDQDKTDSGTDQKTNGRKADTDTADDRDPAKGKSGSEQNAADQNTAGGVDKDVNAKDSGSSKQDTRSNDAADGSSDNKTSNKDKSEAGPDGGADSVKKDKISDSADNSADSSENTTAAPAGQAGGNTAAEDSSDAGSSAGSAQLFISEKTDQDDNIVDDSHRIPVISDPETIPFAPGTDSIPTFFPDAIPYFQSSPFAVSPEMGLLPPQPSPSPRSYVPVSNPMAASWGISVRGMQAPVVPGELPAGYPLTYNYYGTNEQLIASQNIVSGLSIINDGFRFYTVEKVLALAPSVLSINEEMKEDSRQVGLLSENDALYVLSDENNGWLYVESGNVRGFIQADKIIRGSEAAALINSLQNNRAQDAVSGGFLFDSDDSLHYASETVPAAENKAFAYLRCTTKSTVIDKQYAVAENDTPIRESADEGAREIGHLPPGGLCYVIQQADDRWAFVESGNVRGFSLLSELTTGDAARTIVQRTGEGTMVKAQELVPPKDNAALYYSLNSVQEGVPYSRIRTNIVQTAAACIGRPYKWGGNSLTNGCDCSGFVRELYRLYGYNLPRVADAQSRYGIQIPIGDAAPGDLIFFAANGYVYHVGLYAGDGITIEAFSENRGIIATSIGNRGAVWATRIIQD